MVPRYHFNVHDGHNMPDLEGTELKDLATARKTAVQLAGQLLTEQAETFWNGDDWTMEVTGEAGLVLFTLHFFASDAPAALKAPSPR